MDPLSILGAVSAVASLAGAGAKLSIFLLDVSSQIGSAGDEVRDLGIDISLFCAVLRQLQKVLDGSPARRRTSVTAIDTTHQVLDRCRAIFARIEAVVRGLHVDTSKPATGAVAMDFRARMKWAFKRNKVQTYRATLESCKITLTLMVNTLTYADVISSRRISNQQTEIEDAEEEAIAWSLTSAQLRANERLASIEKDEDEDEGEDAPETDLTKDLTAPLPPSYLDSTRSSLVADGPSKAAHRQSSAFTLDLPLHRPPERASVWLNRLVLDDASTRDSSRQASTVSNDCSLPRHRQVEQLLLRWTDQGQHWASLHDHHPHSASAVGTSTLKTDARVGLGGRIREVSFDPAAIRREVTIPVSPGSRPDAEPEHGFFESRQLSAPIGKFVKRPPELEGLPA